MKAPMTRDKCKARLAKFLDFIGIEAEDGNRSLEDNARTFAKKSKSDLNWAFANLVKFIQFQKDRVDKKEIAAATVRNYLYAESIIYESNLELVITDLDKEAILRFTSLKGNRIIDSLVKLFACDVIGCEIVKKGLLLLAASTNRDINQKKLNAALIGDPGLVKSTLLRRAVRLVPNSKYESAQNSSGKSLTAIVEVVPDVLFWVDGQTASQK
jgi:DNA replicative helicase MCM subunit Mcm2 (Cdc46/Mcm family)